MVRISTLCWAVSPGFGLCHCCSDFVLQCEAQTASAWPNFELLCVPHSMFDSPFIEVFEFTFQTLPVLLSPGLRSPCSLVCQKSRCWEQCLWEVISLENKKQNLRKSASIGVPVSVILRSGQGCKLGAWKLSNGCEGLGNPTCHKYMSHSTSWFPHQCVRQLLLFRRKKGKVTWQLPFILMQNSPNRLSSSASMVHMFCVGKGNSEVRQTLFRLFFFLRSVCKDRFC